MTRALLVVTSALSLPMLDAQVERLVDEGHDVHVLCNMSTGVAGQRSHLAVAYHHVNLQREATPVADAKAFARLIGILRCIRPDVISYGTPKASLLAGLASALARVPRRVHLVHGFRSETSVGPKRVALRLSELVAMCSAHDVVYASNSLRRAMPWTFSLVLRLLHRRSHCLEPGSLLGLRSPFTESHIRRRAGERRDALTTTFVYAGRLVRDKGIEELLVAFTRLARERRDVALELWGDYEDGDPLPAHVRSQIIANPKISHRGWVEDVIARLDRDADVVVLPTHREGFPTTVLEAYACGLPVITTDATGAMDSVMHGETGLQFSAGDVDGLHRAMLALATQPLLRHRLGLSGYRWLRAAFDPAERAQYLTNLYVNRR